MAKHSTPKHECTTEFRAGVLRLVTNGEHILNVNELMYWHVCIYWRDVCYY